MLEYLLEENFITRADGYKCCHYEQIPENVQFTYTVMVPRKSHPKIKKIVATGQTMIASYLASVRIKQWMIDEAEIEINQQGYTFNREGWQRIVDEFDGRLPLVIMGVEEGRIIDPQTPMMGWCNTEAGFSWLCGHVETVIQSIGWKMTTVASICKSCKDILQFYAEMTGTNASVDYMLHNFGDRSADGPEAAVMAGIAHAVLFSGSDCTSANRYIKKLYKTDKTYTSSVVASEHFTMTSNSDCKNKDDYGAAEMMVKELEKAVERSKNGIGIPLVSAVIDTYDDERFVKEFLGGKLRDRIKASGGRLVARPDSGDPTTKPGEIGSLLAETFGYIVNDKKYAVLHSSVGVIQGDGLSMDTIECVIKGWVDAGFSLDNFCLGMGSGISHDGRRDDLSFSVKAIANFVDDNWVDLVKDPKTDSGKKSLSGLAMCEEDKDGNLRVVDGRENARYIWLDQPGWRQWFRDGEQIYFQSFDDVKERANK